jgi:hypothetical protein
MANLGQYISKSNIMGLSNEKWLLKNIDTEVKEVVDGTVRRWPGTQKNVFQWYILANGYCVGWNENPSRGWYFPHMRMHAPNRADNGQYTYGGDMSKMCVCGHTLGQHAAAHPHDCFTHTHKEGTPAYADCDCPKFRPSKKKLKVLQPEYFDEAGDPHKVTS